MGLQESDTTWQLNHQTKTLPNMLKQKWFSKVILTPTGIASGYSDNFLVLEA